MRSWRCRTGCRRTWSGRSSCTSACGSTLSFYGWRLGRDGGLAERYPRLDNGKGTLKLPLRQAAEITDAELRAFLAAVLSAPEEPLPG